MVNRRLMRTAACSALLAIVAAVLPASPAAGERLRQAPPRLIVLLVVDQLRTGYLTEYGGTFNAGLRRLMRDGAWFTNGAYPYMNTVTCAGHATIGTGTFPYQHGMVLNSWLDRRSGSTSYCTDDPSAAHISYSNLPAGKGDSPAKLLRPTLGEQIHDRNGRAVALSLKPRSAVTLAGGEADAVVWFDDRGGWSTSSAYTRKAVPFVQEFINANPLSADYDKVWERSLDPGAYKYEDDAEGEARPAGWSRTFPHPLGTPGGAPDAAYYARWQRSPFADEYLARMGMAAVDALKLGSSERTDFLAISFSSLDLVGHAYGPRSHEVQDLLVRLDRTIGRLLDHLDATVGADNYIVGFSSDHGVADVPEQTGTGGRQPGRRAFDALSVALDAALGPGDHVAAVAYTDVYLAPEASRQLRRNPRAMSAAIEALRGLPAIDRVFRGDELDSREARESDDPVRRAAALSYHRDRSGDLILVPKPNWLFSSAVTTHGTHHAYDRQVPVIVLGPTIRAGKYEAAATPADLVPTLAAVAGVRIRRTDGRILAEALDAAGSR